MLSWIIVKSIDEFGVTFSFGRQSDLVLHPTLLMSDVIIVIII